MRDLNTGIIKVLHTFSFVDDPTRILRALRFSALYRFPLEKQTAELLRKALLEGRLDDVSPERVRDEFLLCLKEEDIWRVLGHLAEECILGVLKSPVRPPRHLGASESDILKPAIDWLAGLRAFDAGEMPDRSDIYFAFLISESELSEALSFAEHYHFGDSKIRLAESLESYRASKPSLTRDDLKPSQIVDLLENLPAPYWILLAAGKPDNSPERLNLARYITDLRHVKLEISGNDLIRAGFQPGPAFSETLHAVRQARLNGEVRNREEELSLAKKILSR
jgi:tRNA nucleotidyltransferase (CCA-adding enzyme)